MLDELSFLISPPWWRQAVGSALVFAPACLLPATCLSAANIVLLVGLDHLTSHLSVLTPEALGSAVLIALGCAVAGLVLSLIALGSWLTRLTAWARACLRYSQPPSQAQIDQALADIAAKKGYLAKLWLIASVFLLLPVAPLAILIALHILSTPQLFGREIIVLSLPHWLSMAVSAGAALITVVVVAYSLVLIVHSSVASSEAGEAAWQALKLFFRRWLVWLAVTVIVIALNVVVSDPLLLFGVSPFSQQSSGNLAAGIAGQIWLGLSSLVLWPLSVMPFCNLFKK